MDRTSRCVTDGLLGSGHDVGSAVAGAITVLVWSVGCREYSVERLASVDSPGMCRGPCEDEDMVSQHVREWNAKR